MMKREDYRAVKQMDRVQMEKYFARVYARGVAAGAKATAAEAEKKIAEAYNRGVSVGVNLGKVEADCNQKSAAALSQIDFKASEAVATPSERTNAQ